MDEHLLILIAAFLPILMLILMVGPSTWRELHDKSDHS